MAIFKAYDIRGIYPSQVNEELYYKIGNSLRHLINDCKTIIVGNDMRVSSEPLKKALFDGITDSGVNVLDLGLASTPMLYQASGDFDVDIGVIITASHNSKEYNGMKLCKKNAYPIGWDSGIEKLKDIVDKFEQYIAPNKGKVTPILDYEEKYKEELLKLYNPKRKLKVVIDAGNGMAGLIDNQILKQKADLIELYTTLDGTFPNHEANPIKEETLTKLKQTVIENNADLGFGFDGDADRVGFVDEKGNFIPADMVCAYFVDNFIRKYPNEQNYSCDVRSSKIVREIVESHNKTFFPSRIGHSLVKDLMVKNNIFFSGELSGHFFFKFGDDIRYDSAIRASIEFINMLSETDKPFSEIIKQYQKYYHSPETNFEIHDKAKKILDIEKEFSDGEIDKTDGITVNYGSWWFNVRASNTEDILRLNLEAVTKELYEEKFNLLKQFLSK